MLAGCLPGGGCSCCPHPVVGRRAGSSRSSGSPISCSQSKRSKEAACSGGGVQASNSPGVASRASFGSPANDVAGQGSGTSLNKATPETPMAPRVLAAPRRLGINTTGPSPARQGAPDAGRAVRPSGSSHRVERGTAQRVSWQTCGRGSGPAPSEGPAGRAGARTSSGAGGAALPTLGRSVQAHVGRFWSPPEGLGRVRGSIYSSWDPATREAGQRLLAGVRL